MSDRYTLLTDRQIEFWRELLKPFPDGAYGSLPRGHKTLTYLKKQAIQNRLDSVVGPTGWRCAYRIAEVTAPGIEVGGVVCSLSICCPSQADGEWVWITKEEGGGFENMGREDRSTGEWLEDDDGEWKSGFTNAFRRAAGEFGFGRELYNQGVPFYIADLFGGGPPPQSQAPRPQYAATPPRDDPPPRANGSGAAPPRQFNKLSVPTKPGKGVYAWAMACKDHFGAEVDVLGHMGRYAKKKGWPDRTDQWDEDQTREIVGKAADWIRSLDAYNGEFDTDNFVPPAAARRPEAPASKPDTARPASSEPGGGGKYDPLAGVKKSILAAAKVIIQKQTGRDPETGEVQACVGELAARSEDGEGRVGEVMRGLRECEDRTWLSNILKSANDEIQTLASVDATAAEFEDIPF